MHAFKTTVMRLFWAALVLALTLRLAAADATVPTADIEGAADNQLAKRYEGSFIVSYVKLAFTDFSVPLSPLKPSADPDARDAMNNRVFAPDKKAEVEGALTRIAYVLTGRVLARRLRSSVDIGACDQGSRWRGPLRVQEGGVWRRCRPFVERWRRRHEPDDVFLPRERSQGRSILQWRLRAGHRHQRPALFLGQSAAGWRRCLCHRADLFADR